MSLTAVQLSTRLPARDRETVIISTKDHQNELPRASASCLIQDEPITILVADDDYTDSTSEQVANRLLMVQVIRHPMPLGIVPVRNDVTNKVTIPFACTLDDDAVFTTPSIVRTTLAQFDHPRVAVVTIPLVNFINGERSNTPNRQRDPSNPFVSPHFFRGANCIKLSAFHDVGGYRGLFARQGEGSEFAMRLMCKGWVSRVGTANEIHHFHRPRATVSP